MQDDLDEVALNTLLAEGLDLPTSLAGATRETQEAQPPRLLPHLVQLVLVLGAVVFAGGLYLLWR